MDKYEVMLFPRAFRDLEEIYSYISLEKLEPCIARDHTDRIWDAIESLESFPHSHQDRLVGRYAGKGYKQLIIDNYIAVYRIDEEQKRVYVVTIQYGGRDL
jgi:addiction module RelE/StbE family toxin